MFEELHCSNFELTNRLNHHTIAVHRNPLESSDLIDLSVENFSNEEILELRNPFSGKD